MDNKTISNCIRQSRYKAKKLNIYSDVTISDVITILNKYGDGCAYCGSIASTIDHPFPLKHGAPNVPANILPVCKNCKNHKKNHDIVWLYSTGYLNRSKYIDILTDILSRRGGECIKECVKKATGIIGAENEEEIS